MRIALLNLPYDNNYGGNLQRYALMSILQRMGHDVTHLNLRWNLGSWWLGLLKLPIRVVEKYILRKGNRLCPEILDKLKYKKVCSNVDDFYNKYIKHSEIIESKRNLYKYTDFECFIVGSDQVWRKRYTDFMYGIGTFFFDYLPLEKKRIAYAVSLGTDENELSKDDIQCLSKPYSNFSAVSVREFSALDLFKTYGWNTPQAVKVLDPTLLLTPDDYKSLIYDGSTKKAECNLFCYILDETEEKRLIIEKEARDRNLKPAMFSLNSNLGIQQWLRCIFESELVITDSYHGFIFSIIFNKPFILINNKRRGNSRFDSICNELDIDLKTIDQDWDKINQILSIQRDKSINWLTNALKLHV